MTDYAEGLEACGSGRREIVAERFAEGRLASGPYARFTGLCFFVFAERMPGGWPAETADEQQRVCFCGWRLR